MQIYTAKARYVKISPSKVRPIVELIRGKTASVAFNWLNTYGSKKSVFVIKTLKSAVCNAFDLLGRKNFDCLISVAKVDNGPYAKYAVPGAMGRGVMRRRRSSHIEIGVIPMEAYSNDKNVMVKGETDGTKS